MLSLQLRLRCSNIVQSERKGILWFVKFGASAQMINMDKYAPFSMVCPAKSKFNFHVVLDGNYNLTCRQTELVNYFFLKIFKALKAKCHKPANDGLKPVWKMVRVTELASVWSCVILSYIWGKVCYFALLSVRVSTDYVLVLLQQPAGSVGNQSKV